MKPVLFVSGHAPPDRLGAFARLHEREELTFALFGGRSAHGVEASAAAGDASVAAGEASAATGDASAATPFPHVEISQREVLALAGSGRFRAVVCGTGGRVALPAAWRGARRAGVPVILWSSLWAHPRTLPHAASYLALARLYRSADAVVTYGLHVSAYVRARGARNVHEAPQAVDNEFWSAPSAPCEHPAPAGASFLFVGRPVREKGVRVLLAAWRASGLGTSGAALVLVLAGEALEELALPGRELPPGARAVGALSSAQLRNFYGACDVLVVPSIATRRFREPWGLVVNEAMNQRLPIIASDAVGAAAGGLVRHERNGLVVPAGDPGALARALERLAADRGQRARLGAAGARDVRAFSHDAWAAGFSRALASVGASAGH